MSKIVKKILLKLIIINLSISTSLYATINFKTGWNFIGFDNDKNFVTDDILSDESKIKYIWQYDNLQKTWMAYSPNNQIKALIESNGYVYKSTLDKTSGAWVFAKSDFEYIETKQHSQTNNDITIHDGWNLVSAVDNSNISIDSEIFNNRSIWINRNNSWYFKQNKGNTNRTDVKELININPNEAFWVYKETQTQQTPTQVIDTEEIEEITRKDAIKFLRQAAFRTTEDDINYIINNGYEAWIDNQYSLVSELDDENDNNYGYLETTLRILNSYNPEFYPTQVISDPTLIDETIIDGKRLDLFKNSVFWDKALNSQNQLRQRVAYALSQILVVSNDSPAGKAPTSRGETMITYYDKLYRHSFGNYRDLLFDVTRSSAMGYFLTYIGSSKYAPDENYARELTQLFTVGLYELNLDGTKKLDSNGNPIPSYDQQHVTDLSHVFTGWALDNKQGDELNFGANGKSDGSWVSDLRFISQKHSVGVNLDLIGDATMTTSEDGIADINTALNILFANHNVAPFISRHLIMRLVTSNPTPQYIQRVATIFNDNGNGVKGDLKAVVKAILLDPEARGDSEVSNFGKVDEMLVAYSHFMSHFKAKPAPRMVINTRISKGVLENRDVNNIYWIDPQKEFGQAPLGAPTVFNFYSNEFIPSDEYFALNSVVSPELELQNIPNLIGFSNLVESVLTLREKYYILELTTLQKGSGANGTYESMEEWANNVTLGIGGQGLYLDLSEEYNIFEKALDNENIANNDFANLSDGSGENENQTRAVNALIEHLDNKLFGNAMSQEYKDALLAHVNSFDYSANDRNRASRMKAIVPTIIRAIVTSPLFMVLK
jgi:uncharacterized protein (DUF1800 family)